MCFHLSITKSAAALQNRYGVDFPEHVFFSPSNHVNAFTHPVLPVIGMENTGSFLPMSWGLIPPWVRDSKFAEKLKKGTLNARSETMLEKPSFRNAAIHGRCIVPADAFYEWQHGGDGKILYRITIDTEIFSFAGLYETWRDPKSGDDIMGFSILTCKANPLMEKIHNTKKRMPVILQSEFEKIWLNNNLSKHEIQNICRPYPQENMQAKPINNSF